MRWIIRVVTWDISTVFIPSRVGRLPHRENAQSSGRDATIPINISAQPAMQYVNNVLSADNHWNHSVRQRRSTGKWSVLVSCCIYTPCPCPPGSMFCSLLRRCFSAVGDAQTVVYHNTALHNGPKTYTVSGVCLCWRRKCLKCGEVGLWRRGEVEIMNECRTTT